MLREIYLDYAATAGVRPPEVADAVSAFLRDVGGTPGRSGHRRAREAGRIALRCRRVLAELLGVTGDPGWIAFQFNATHALNTALHGTLRPGDRTVRTSYDHNAVRRPVAALRRWGIGETVLAGRADGGVDLEEAREALRGDGRPARLLVLPHASNVLGARLPVRELTELAHEHGALVLLDAAQTVGHLPVDVEALGVDLLAFTGHKGLLGPQGTGGLWVRPGIEIEPLLRGGTGSDSDSAEMPSSMPDRLEAGTQNGAGIAGLLAGAEWVRDHGVASLHAREAALKARLLQQIRTLPGLCIHSPPAPDGVGIVTVSGPHMTSAEFAHCLEREHGVLVRAGLHCAPEAHRLLGTERDGAVRLSLGWATTAGEIDTTAAALARLCVREAA